MTCIQAILAIWLALPHCYIDRRAGETLAQRVALYRPAAAAICQVTRNPQARRFLAHQAWEETKLCRAVLEWRCHEMPRGQRCDRGRAIGPWQNWRPWCPRAWDEQLTTLQRYVAGARCSLRLYWLGLHRCRTLEGAFVAQKGRGLCHAPWAAARVRRMR